MNEQKTIEQYSQMELEALGFRLLTQKEGIEIQIRQIVVELDRRKKLSPLPEPV